MATLLIGPEKQRFKVNRKLLCATSSFFRERLDGPQNRSVSLWLPGELPSMFTLFVDWLHTPRHHFRRHLENAVAEAAERDPNGLHDMHWALIRLHLFAAHLSLSHLQDSAMDALQDLYLSCDWDVPPGLLSYLYTRCDALPAVRLRRWAVAMVAFSLTGSTLSSSPAKFHSEYNDLDYDAYDDEDDDTANRFRHLIDEIPELSDDYTVHMNKMADSGLDVRFKNPQLRIPANKLRNEERAFGFRECSFHSHRSTVGERRCPHERKRLRSLAAAEAKDDAAAAAAAGAGAGAAAALAASVAGDNGRRFDADRLMVHELAGSPDPGWHLGGLTSPTRRPSQREKDGLYPRHLFADAADDRDAEREMALKHVRSVSSTLK